MAIVNTYPVQPFSNGAQIELVNLTKAYQDFFAVDHINLSIREGEFLTLLGPSGSGKTTTLSMIAGFQLPTEGEILINGKSVTYVPTNKRNIGMVFQNYALFPHMTVEQNISFPLEMQKVPKKQIKNNVEKVLEVVRLKGFNNRYPRQLSGGQQQRIALARAVVFNPSLLLMDEPLGALDKKLREELQIEIKRIHHDLGITVIYVTHDQQEALTMSDRIAVMNHGLIEQLGSPSELYMFPKSEFVAGFLGESNIIKGTIENISNSTCVIQTNDGLQITGPLPHNAKMGEELSFIIRPEWPIFNKIGESTNSYKGTIQEVLYIGDITKYVVRISESVSIVVKHPNRPGLHPYQVKTEVTVSWELGDIISLRAADKTAVSLKEREDAI